MVKLHDKQFTDTDRMISYKEAIIRYWIEGSSLSLQDNYLVISKRFMYIVNLEDYKYVRDPIKVADIANI